MSSDKLTTLTIQQSHEGLVSKDFSSRELTEAYLKIIEAKDPEVNAFLEVYGDALTQADSADNRLAGGASGLLTGIPIALKDNILIKGRRVGAASRILEGYHATYSATIVEKLSNEGAVFVGRTNMDEFAMGSSTEHSAYGPTRNPHDISRVPGGSSGGSAAAVAMDGALVALGSDTGGSIRQPAALCGVVGLKPTYGAVSRNGLIAMGSSLDQIGPFTKSVADAEIIFNALKGQDIMDSTTLPDSYWSREVSAGQSEKIVVGVPRKFLTEGIDKDVIDNFEKSLEHLKTKGVEIREVDLPNISYALACYYIIMPAEVSSNLARFDGIRFGAQKEGKDLLEDYNLTRGEFFGSESRRRIILGTYVLSHGYYDAYYRKAVAVRSLISEDFSKVFDSGVDVVATPTTPTPAFKIGEKSGDPLQMYKADIFTVPANIAGIPAISIPSGTVERESKDLPIAIQFMGKKMGEQTLFDLGKIFNDESEESGI